MVEEQEMSQAALDAIDDADIERDEILLCWWRKVDVQYREVEQGSGRGPGVRASTGRRRAVSRRS
jgi:hypothetical protein